MALFSVCVCLCMNVHPYVFITFHVSREISFSKTMVNINFRPVNDDTHIRFGCVGVAYTMGTEFRLGFTQ